MATTRIPAPAAPHERADALIQHDGQATLARIWIAHGCLWLALIVYVWGAWIVSGDFTPNKIGASDSPTWYSIAVWIVQIGLGLIFTAWILWHFVIGPKLRT